MSKPHPWRTDIPANSVRKKLICIAKEHEWIQGADLKTIKSVVGSMGRRAFRTCGRCGTIQSRSLLVGELIR